MNSRRQYGLALVSILVAGMKRMAVAVMWLAVVALWLAGPAVGAAERTWNGPATGDWFTAANWLPVEGQDYPQEGDTVIINTGSVLLTNETAALASFSITNSTLIFSNWNTRLRATEVTIHKDGNLTHTPVNTNTAPGVTNRVWIDCTTFTLEQDGKIDLQGKGFFSTQGVGAGGNCCGAGHGGRGGIRPGYSPAGAIYGSASAPILPGSGGGPNGVPNWGGSGGGAVRIDAVTAIIHGTINADGETTVVSHRGGGSGGSIYITCETVSGSGSLRAEGGGISAGAGAGAGGRIALIYDTTKQAAVNPNRHWHSQSNPARPALPWSSRES